MSTLHTKMTVDEFMEAPPKGCELWDGEVVEVTEVTEHAWQHGWIQARLVRLLGDFVDQHNLGSYGV